MNSEQSEGNILKDKPSFIVNQLTNSKVNLPLDVTTELSQYTKFYITKGQDFFRIVCCCEDFFPEYYIYGEMPDGDKKLLFSCSRHFILCNCFGCSEDCPDYCQGCGCFCLFCGYLCTDIILFQMDYKRNNRCFYTQGISLPKGCYICKRSKCACCQCSCCLNSLDLNENINPKMPSLGKGKGYTKVGNCCDCCSDDSNCKQCGDYVATYTSQEGIKGPTVRAPCFCCKCDCCYCCCCCCNCCNFDVELDIEDSQGVKKGNIFIYGGCCSNKVENKCWHCPRRYFDINMPPDFTSEEKFQVIADLIHFDLTYGIV
jgi:hypothetical protein